MRIRRAGNVRVDRRVAVRADAADVAVRNRRLGKVNCRVAGVRSQSRGERVGLKIGDVGLEVGVRRWCLAIERGLKIGLRREGPGDTTSHRAGAAHVRIHVGLRGGILDERRVGKVAGSKAAEVHGPGHCPAGERELGR